MMINFSLATRMLAREDRPKKLGFISHKCKLNLFHGKRLTSQPEVKKMYEPESFQRMKTCGKI